MKLRLKTVAVRACEHSFLESWSSLGISTKTEIQSSSGLLAHLGFLLLLLKAKQSEPDVLLLSQIASSLSQFRLHARGVLLRLHEALVGLELSDEGVGRF